MIARVTLASDSYPNTEPVASGISDIQFGEQNPNLVTGGAEGVALLAHNTEEEALRERVPLQPKDHPGTALMPQK